MAKYKLKLNLSDGTIITTSNSIDIPVDTDLVHKTGNENIVGTKTLIYYLDEYINYKTILSGDHIDIQRINSGIIADSVSLSTNNFSIRALSAVNATLKSNSAEFNIEVPASDGSNVPINFNLKDFDSNSYTLIVPYKNGTLSTIEDFETETSKYQSASVVVGNATTNINGRVFQNYTATLVTSGSYTYYQILKNGSNPTEEEAKEYMRYMTGSMFLPKYNYDFPKQTVFTFADRSTWKPQYSSSDGLRLYRLTTALALDGDVVHKGTISSPSNENIYGIKTFYSKQIIGSSNLSSPTAVLDIGKTSYGGGFTFYSAGTSNGGYLEGQFNGSYSSFPYITSISKVGFRQGYGGTHAADTYSITLTSTAQPTGNRTLTLPDKSGTLATTDDCAQIIDLRGL